MRNLYNAVPTGMVCGNVYIVTVTVQYVKVKLLQKQNIVTCDIFQVFLNSRILWNAAPECLGG